MLLTLLKNFFIAADSVIFERFHELGLRATSNFQLSLPAYCALHLFDRRVGEAILGLLVHGLWQEAVDLRDESSPQVCLHTPALAPYHAPIQPCIGSVKTTDAHWSVTEHAIVRLFTRLVLGGKEGGAVPVSLAVVRHPVQHAVIQVVSAAASTIQARVQLTRVLRTVVLGGQLRVLVPFSR